MDSRDYKVIGEKIGKASDIARRISDMRRERARQACKEAGLSPELLGIHPHNAMCGYNSGKPWPGVDYKKVRLCIYLLNKQFEGNRIVDRYYRRLCGLV